MNYRNPVFTANNAIDCEIDHPTYGWIPFTCDPNDKGAAFDTAALYAEMRPHAAPYTPSPQPTPEEIHAEVRAARAAAYREESDPLFFQAQRGDVDMQAWHDKVDEIRARYPYE
jgi:hypothetical protein